MLATTLGDCRAARLRLPGRQMRHDRTVKWQWIGGGAVPQLRSCETEASASGDLALHVISSLPDPSLHVFRSLPAVVKKLGDENFVANAPEVNINASGDTAEEALENLQDVVATVYRLYSSLPPHTLGPEPARQINLLRQHIQG